MEPKFTSTESNHIASFSMVAKESTANTPSPISADGPDIPEIDELLVEILGENYRDNTKSDQQKDKGYATDTPLNIKYITGSKELDELVEAILGKGWEKDDGLPVERKVVSEFSQKELDELIESILGKGWDIEDVPASGPDTLRAEAKVNFQDDIEQLDNATQSSSDNLDALVESILSNGEAESSVEAGNSRSINDRHITNRSKIEKKSNTRSSPRTSDVRNISPLPQIISNTDSPLAGFEQENQVNRPVLTGILVLAVLISAIALWKYFTPTEDINPSSLDIVIAKGYESKTRADVSRQVEKKDYSIIEPAITTKAESLILPKAVPTESFTQNKEATLPVDAYQTTAQNTTISPSDNIDHYKIDTNTDNLAAFIETLPESDLPTLILPIEDIQPVENNNELSVITPKPLKSETIIYTVVKGDTFWAIAERFVNNPYKYTELAEQNKIMNPDRIYPGNKIRIIKISR